MTNKTNPDNRDNDFKGGLLAFHPSIPDISAKIFEFLCAFRRPRSRHQHCIVLKLDYNTNIAFTSQFENIADMLLRV